MDGRDWWTSPHRLILEKHISHDTGPLSKKGARFSFGIAALPIAVFAKSR